MYVDCNYQPCDGQLILATGRCNNERRDMYNDLHLYVTSDTFHKPKPSLKSSQSVMLKYFLKYIF